MLWCTEECQLHCPYSSAIAEAVHTKKCEGRPLWLDAKSEEAQISKVGIQATSVSGESVRIICLEHGFPPRN